eukprot:6206225-Pleurochrysis_carterae.AAC.2
MRSSVFAVTPAVRVDASTSNRNVWLAGSQELRHADPFGKSVHSYTAVSLWLVSCSSFHLVNALALSLLVKVITIYSAARLCFGLRALSRRSAPHVDTLSRVAAYR